MGGYWRHRFEFDTKGRVSVSDKIRLPTDEDLEVLADVAGEYGPYRADALRVVLGATRLVRELVPLVRTLLDDWDGCEGDCASAASLRILLAQVELDGGGEG